MKVKTKRYSSKNDDTILMELYRRVYNVSTPPANFDELFEKAPLNEFHQKVIPYRDYQCDESDMRAIIEEVLTEYKVPKWKRRSFEISFWLGCSPMSK